MAKGLNKVLLIGTLDDEPELRLTLGGRHCLSFTLAIPRSWTTADGEAQEKTEWFNVIAWGSLAEANRARLRRGQSVYVEGRLQTGRWHDEEGKTFFRTEVVANDIIALNRAVRSD